MLGIFLQLLISGIAMGFVYGLVGIEYTLIWNSTGLLNFAHERIIMLGAYVLAARSSCSWAWRRFRVLWAS